MSDPGQAGAPARRRRLPRDAAGRAVSEPGGHRCDESCICPEHRTPMIWWPGGDDHACQDVTCEYGHGVYRALAAQEAAHAGRLRKACNSLAGEVIAGLTTDEHHMVMRIGLPFCQCGHSLGSGDASGCFITHALALLRPP